jgi:aminopeptidase-like protein/spore coat polysaccharide biosynthesis protein SpsF (cytidylyltransferase family)
MLTKLGHTPLIEWVLRRLLMAKKIDQVVLATSDTAKDDALADLATQLNVSVFRGSESDVLTRFIGAAEIAGATNVIRVCADNPFIDPVEIDRLSDYFLKHDFDYVCNHQDRLGSSYADGFGAEMLSAQLLKTISARATEPLHREHVTSYLWDHANTFSLNAIPAPDALRHAHLKFDVDTPEDLIKLQRLVDKGVDLNSQAAEIIAIANGDSKNAAERDEIDGYLQRLFPLCRSITGNPNRETLEILKELIPLNVHEVATGTHVYDWTIPDEWNIADAYIADSTGKRLIDFRVNNLHVVSYSTPVRMQMSWGDLKPHIHTHPALPAAIPYRTSYYLRNWGFCVTHAQSEMLEKLGGPFEVVVDSALTKGALTYGDLLIPGKSKQEILISCYICHPSMVNDSLSGVLLTAFLARQLIATPSLRYSYRVAFVPETIGAIAYCFENEQALKKIDCGLVVTTVGGPGKYGYKQSFDHTHAINLLIEEVFNESGYDFIKYPFDIHGSDERQYSSQGFRINMATISRDKYYEYPEYHSSLDDLALVTADQIHDTLTLYRRLIEKLENRSIYRNRVPHGEVMLSQHELYPTAGGAQVPGIGAKSELDLILWALFYCDGKLDLKTIARRLDTSEETLTFIVDKLVAKGVLEVVA